MIFELVQDFHDAVAAMPREHPRHRMLELFEEAIRRDIRFIARHPTTLFQCMWNTCWWYDCPEAAKHYQEPEPYCLPEEPPWRLSGVKLSDLLHDWRSKKGIAMPGFPWLRSLRPPPVHLAAGQFLILRGHEHGVEGISFSPDGARLVSWSGDRTVRVWNAISGEAGICVRMHPSWIVSASFSYDGQLLVIQPSDQAIRVFDANNGALLDCSSAAESPQGCGAYSPDSRYILDFTGSKVYVRDKESGRELLCFQEHFRDITTAFFLPDGKTIISASEDHTVRIWDAQTGRELHCLEEHERAVTDVSISPDNLRVASASEDGTVRVWDVRDGKNLLCLRGHSSWVTCVSFSQDGQWIASGSLDKTVRIWDSDDGTEVYCFHGHDGTVDSLAFAPDGARIATGSRDCTVRLWELREGRQFRQLHGHTSIINCVRISPNGRLVATAGGDRTVRIWDAITGQALHTLPGHELWATRASFSPDSRRVATASKIGRIRIWATSSGQELRCFDYPNGPAVSLSDDERFIANGEADGNVLLWQVVPGIEVLAQSVCFSPDGGKVLSWLQDKTVRVWDTVVGCELCCLARGNHLDVWHVCFSPDGSRIATGDVHGVVHVWDARTGEEQLCLRGHGNGVSGITFSPDGRQICSSSKNMTIRVWDAESGSCVEIISGIGDIAAIADGKRKYRWRVLAWRFETVVELNSTRKMIAWFPTELGRLATYPSGSAWGGALGDHLYMISLEWGGEP